MRSEVADQITGNTKARQAAVGAVVIASRLANPIRDDKDQRELFLTCAVQLREMDSFSEQISATPLAGKVALIVLLVVSFWLVQWKRTEETKEESFTGNIPEGTEEDTEEKSLGSGNDAAKPPLGDPWQERKKRGIKAVNTNKTDVNGGKPFGSKYYYAHNNTKATGGYKDGLSMEDYHMNGPRLLSRGGVSIKNSGGQISAATSDKEANESEYTPPVEESGKKRTSRTKGKQTISISKYLWDDPGDSKGTASIRIDNVPSQKGSTTIPWKDVEVADISAVLEGEGLAVTVKTKTEVDYALKFAKLYGEVEEVTVKSTKRLIVRLKKKRAGTGNFQAWPHPHDKSVMFR